MDNHFLYNALPSPYTVVQLRKVFHEEINKDDVSDSSSASSMIRNIKQQIDVNLINQPNSKVNRKRDSHTLDIQGFSLAICCLAFQVIYTLCVIDFKVYHIIIFVLYCRVSASFACFMFFVSI